MSAKQAGGFPWGKLDENDLQLIEFLKHDTQSARFAEIVRIVEGNGYVQFFTHVYADRQRKLTVFILFFLSGFSSWRRPFEYV